MSHQQFITKCECNASAISVLIQTVESISFLERMNSSCWWGWWWQRVILTVPRLAMPSCSARRATAAFDIWRWASGRRQGTGRPAAAKYGIGLHCTSLIT